MGTRRRKGRRAFGATRRLPSGRWQASYLGPDGVRRIAPQTFPKRRTPTVALDRRGIDGRRGLASARAVP